MQIGSKLSKKDWKVIRLGDEQYFQLATGGTPSTENKEYWEDGTIPWLSSGEVHKKVIHNADGFITEKGFQHSNARFYPSHSILIALAGQGKTRGTAAITEIETTSNQSIAAVIPNQDLVDPYYAYYYLDSLYEELRSISAGAGRAGLSLSILAEVSIKLPEKPIQKRIANVLSCIDDAIGRTKAAVVKHQRIKTSLVQNLLTKGIDEKGNIRSSETHQFKISPLGNIPKEWGISGLKEKGGKERSYLRTGPFGSSLKGSDWVEDGVPVVTIGSLGEGQFIHSELFHVTDAKANLLRAYALMPGDVVFSRVADVGRSAVVTEKEQGWIMSSNLMRISLDKNQVAPAFIYLNIVFNQNTRKQIRSLINAGGRDLANSAVMNSLIFAWPELDEQERIIDMLDRAETYQRTQQLYLGKLYELKAGLTRDLLKGKKTIENLPPARVATENSVKSSISNSESHCRSVNNATNGSHT